MPNKEVPQFYYTRDLPARSVSIAELNTTPLAPVQLTSVNNTPYLAGTLGVWRGTTSTASPADFTAPDYNQPVTISGASYYYVDNQFFEITTAFAADGSPLFYNHPLPSGVSQVAILDLEDSIQSANVLVSNQILYHSMDGSAYKVRYVDSSGVMRSELLLYNPVLSEVPYAPSNFGYVFTGRIITLNTNSNVSIRFLRPNGYLVSAPYNGAPNTPWFPRVGFSLRPVAPEWATQVFLPQRPYILASWVPARVLSSTIVEFERKQIIVNPQQLPDIIVFASDYSVKYALDGSAPGSPPKKGTFYNWKRGQVKAVDFYNARVDLRVTLDPTDIVFGFYSYREQDVVYQALDVNPFTNPNVRNRVVWFYYRTNSDPFRVIYHQITDEAGALIAGQTNDPNPLANFSSVSVFAQLTVGAGISPNQFSISDTRVRGGGLAPQFQDIPQAVNFWDIGHLDGKPFPAAGALVVHLPVSILEKMSRDQVKDVIAKAMPAGALPSVFYYDPSGQESR